MDIFERFLRYLSIDTTSDPVKKDTPSTNGQRKLADILVKELNDLNLDMIHYNKEHCYVYGKLNGKEELPKIGFIAHLDTAKDALGKNIEPNIIQNYDGNNISLCDNVIFSSKEYPDLNNHMGKTLITTKGKTLLGADDKAGIAEIMNMLEYFATSNEEHGDIFVCFTPDEEIGLGTLHFDRKFFNPDFAYTVDGSSLGEFSYENFNAATATINIKGVSAHCGYAKDKMINAGRIATIINSLLPDELPENTENYEGFFHLEEITGNMSYATMKYLIRDFDKDNFEKRKQILNEIVARLNEKYNNCIELSIKDTYQNMLDVISKEKSLIDGTLKSISDLGITPEVIPIRGGTDGTDISFMGIPCPNLGTGGHNFHSIYEYICLEDMEKSSDILISIIKTFAKDKTKKTNPN